MESQTYPSANEVQRENQNREALLAQQKREMTDLRGKTLEVYYYMVESKKNKFGVREIQRELNYSSPSIAAYHLNRLYEYQLIKKSDDGQYYIDGDPVALGALKDHVQLAGLIVPRILIYGVFSVISIIMSIFFMILKSDIYFWFGYFITINLIVLGLVIRDAFKISNNLKVKNS